jgi:hypothetical protein
MNAMKYGQVALLSRVFKSIYYTFIRVYGIYGLYSRYIQFMYTVYTVYIYVYTVYIYVYAVYIRKQFLRIIYGLNNPTFIPN